MAQTADTPIYNLKAVVQETGLKPDTLRAWERRYDLPSPKRAPSGHRLYTQRDIDILKWLIARQEEGLNISRAVALWQQLEAEQGNPLHSPLSGFSVSPSSVSSPSSLTTELSTGTHDTTIARLRELWVAACLAFDELRAEQTLAQAFALFSIETVCLELIQKGLAAVGEGWYQGRITVQQEHFASALAMRRLEALLASTPPPTREPIARRRILVGCPPEEAHTFAPLLLSLLLRRRGWDVLYLGADIPLDSLELTIRTVKPSLAVFTAQQLYTAASLLEMAQVFLAEHIALAFGGLVFNQTPQLRQSIPGYFLGEKLEGAVQTIEQIMLNPRPQPVLRAIPANYQQALYDYQGCKARIEASVWRRMELAQMPQHLLASANTTFGRNLLAALILGDMDYLNTDMPWIAGLLANHYQAPVRMLNAYLAAYLAAVQEHLEERSEVLVQGLTRLVKSQATTNQADQKARNR